MVYHVEIVSQTTGQVVESIPCNSWRIASRTMQGVNINLNHEEFYTRLKEPEDADLHD